MQPQGGFGFPCLKNDPEEQLLWGFQPGCSGHLLLVTMSLMFRHQKWVLAAFQWGLGGETWEPKEKEPKNQVFMAEACCAMSEQFAFTVAVQACKYCVGREELPILAVPAQT